MSLSSNLGPRIGPSVWNNADIRAQAFRLWQAKRIAMIAVDEICNDFERQTVVNVATVQLGEGGNGDGAA